jgi:hypothetical protein
MRSSNRRRPHVRSNYFRSWHEAGVAVRPLSRWRSGVKQTKTERPSNDADDPNVWSGRASQEVSSIWLSVLHQCIRPLIGAVHCSGPTWISARGRSLYRTGLDRAIWVTSVRSRREDRSPSLRYLSQTSAGKGSSASLLRHRRLLISSVPWFVLMAVPSSRPDPRHATRAGAVKAGPPGPLAELGLDGAEHGAMIMQIGSNH